MRVIFRQVSRRYPLRSAVVFSRFQRFLSIIWRGYPARRVANPARPSRNRHSARQPIWLVMPDCARITDTRTKPAVGAPHAPRGRYDLISVAYSHFAASSRQSDGRRDAHLCTSGRPSSRSRGRATSVVRRYTVTIRMPPYSRDPKHTHAQQPLRALAVIAYWEEQGLF